jgi:hypothetical protein
VTLLDRKLREELPRIASQLTLDVESERDNLRRRGRRRAKRRRFQLAVVAVVCTAVGATTVPRLLQRAATDRISTESPAGAPTHTAPADPRAPQPPRTPPPTELSDKATTTQTFPISIEQQNEQVAPGSVRHRSGGPYLSLSQMVDQVAQRLGCGTDAWGATTRCDSVVVRFFNSYESAYREYGQAFRPYVGNLGHDREVYLATAYGSFPFCRKGDGVGTCPVYRDHVNEVYDATIQEPASAEPDGISPIDIVNGVSQRALQACIDADVGNCAETVSGLAQCMAAKLQCNVSSADLTHGTPSVGGSPASAPTIAESEAIALALAGATNPDDPTNRVVAKLMSVAELKSLGQLRGSELPDDLLTWVVTVHAKRFTFGSPSTAAREVSMYTDVINAVTGAPIDDCVGDGCFSVGK